MRKRLKQKLRSCKMCKPYKMGWENRWKPRELARLKDAERAVRKDLGCEEECSERL